ncbi:hypothetical protein FRC12_011217 [Ceratobasidium sp. 428]|nr:hypothetical protein FRC12_011217 [Ceratobasidium sp. 428]
MSNVYSEAFEAWQDARVRFKAALKVYSDACSVFRVMCSGPLVQNTTQSMLEGVMVALDNEIPGMASDIEQVRSANWAVNLVRNKSTTLVPINILPAELLTRIFESLCYSREILGEMGQLLRSPWTLAWVNTYWRQLAFSNSYLWARIHMPTWAKLRGQPYKQARTQLTYARNLPLDVMLDSTKEKVAAKIMSHRATEELFCKVVPRLRSLAYDEGDSASYSVKNVLFHWIQYGTPGTTYYLDLRLLDKGSSPSNDLRLKIQSSSTPIERIEAFFAPVQHLALHNQYIGWSSALYHGLIELDLFFYPKFDHFPTASEFAAMLSASPCLRALKLRGFGLQLQNSLDTVEPIRLDCLEVLFLGDIRSRSLHPLLPMFQPGSLPLYMRFNIPKQSADIVHYVQLLRRSSVVKLMVVGNGCRLPRSLLAFLSGLEYLCLCNLVLDISLWASMRESLISYANEQYPSVWPSLRTLHLHECTLHISESQPHHNNSTPYSFMLWIWNGSLFHETDRLFIEKGSVRGQTILRSFSSYVPGMQEVQNDKSILLEAWGSALGFAPYSIK